jgi:hypothetical protein
VTPEKLARLAFLQQGAAHRLLNVETSNELDALRREFAASPEVADDPATLFTDESRRPQLDGSDYGDVQRKRDCDEFEGLAKSYLTLLGRVAFEAVIAAALKR